MRFYSQSLLHCRGTDGGKPGYSLAGQPVLHVDTHQAADEVLGLLGDVVPVRRVELKLA